VRKNPYPIPVGLIVLSLTLTHWMMPSTAKKEIRSQAQLSAPETEPPPMQISQEIRELSLPKEKDVSRFLRAVRMTRSPLSTDAVGSDVEPSAFDPLQGKWEGIVEWSGSPKLKVSLVVMDGPLKDSGVLTLEERNPVAVDSFRLLTASRQRGAFYINSLNQQSLQLYFLKSTRSLVGNVYREAPDGTLQFRGTVRLRGI
jgi:hypothetical protein